METIEVLYEIIIDKQDKLINHLISLNLVYSFEDIDEMIEEINSIKSQLRDAIKYSNDEYTYPLND